jgi:hypothetical protein
MTNAIVAMKMTPTTPSCQKCSTQPAVVKMAQQFLEALRSIESKQNIPPSIRLSDAAEGDKPEESHARASKLEVRTVSKV